MGSLYSYALSIFKKNKFYIFCVFILAFSGSLLKILSEHQIKNIIDLLGLHPDSLRLELVFGFMLYKFLCHGAYFLYRVLNIYGYPKIIGQIVESSFHMTAGHTLSWFEKNLSGETTTKMADFQEQAGSLVINFFYLLNSLFSVMIGLVFLFNTHFIAGLVVLIFIFIHTPVIFLLLRKQVRIQGRYIHAKQKFIGIINDHVANISLIKLIGKVSQEWARSLKPSMMRWCSWNKKRLSFDAYGVDLPDTLMVTILSAVQIFLLAYLYAKGHITAGQFAFVSILTVSIHDDLDKVLDKILFEVNPALATLHTSFQVLGDPKEIEFQAPIRLAKALKGSIHFKQVTIKYPNAPEPILLDLNFSIQPGERIGVVGVSGAGKTTLIKALLHAVDLKKGQIFLDDMCVSTMDPIDVRANIAFVPQEITLLHQSVFKNLTLGCPHASLQKVIHACQMAGIDQDIQQWPQGYATLVGEKGAQLSGGQRQRLAIARALLKESPIFLLDEATSALDGHTERHVQNALQNLPQKPTLLVIAHRLSTLLMMDRILVLEKGRIVQEGAHETLIGVPGLYQALWNLQPINKV